MIDNNTIHNLFYFLFILVFLHPVYKRTIILCHINKYFSFKEFGGLMRATDIHVICDCDPLKAKSCSLFVKEETTTHKSNRMRTVYYDENCH